MKLYVVTFKGTARIYVSAYDEDDAYDKANEMLDPGEFKIDNEIVEKYEDYNY